MAARLSRSGATLAVRARWKRRAICSGLASPSSASASCTAGDLLGQGFRQGGFRDRLGGADCQFDLLALRFALAALRVLIVGPQPADVSGRFFRRALLVEINEAEQDFLVAEIDRPAIGLGDRRVDAVVNVSQNADKTLLIDLPVLALDGLAGAQLSQHVVHLRQRHPIRVPGRLAIAALLRLHHDTALAVEVDAAPVAAPGVGEGHRPFEAIVVGRAVAVGRLGPFDIKQIREFGGKALEIGHFAAAGGFPALDEGVDVGEIVGHEWFGTSEKDTQCAI